jgi:hypothetical protein
VHRLNQRLHLVVGQAEQNGTIGHHRDSDVSVSFVLTQ